MSSIRSYFMWWLTYHMYIIVVTFLNHLLWLMLMHIEGLNKWDADVAMGVGPIRFLQRSLKIRMVYLSVGMSVVVILVIRPARQACTMLLLTLFVGFRTMPEHLRYSAIEHRSIHSSEIHSVFEGLVHSSQSCDSYLYRVHRSCNLLYSKNHWVFVSSDTCRGVYQPLYRFL